MRLRNKLLLILFSTGAGLVLALYLAFFHFGLLEYLVNRKLQDLVSRNLPLKIHITDIAGDYHSRLLLTGIELTYDDGRNGYAMARIPRISLAYSIADLWHGRIVFKEVVIDSARLSLRKTAEQGWLVPRGAAGQGGKGKPPQFSIETLRINDLSLDLRMPQDSLLFSGLQFAGKLNAYDGNYSAEIDSIRFNSSQTKYKLNFGSGRATLSDSNLLVQDMHLVTDSSDLYFNAQVRLGAQPAGKAFLETSRLNLPEALAHLGTKLNGNLVTRGEISYEGDTVSGMLTVTGIFENRTFDSLDLGFDFSANVLRLDTLHGVILNGCELKGRGQIDLSIRPEQYSLIGTVRHFNLDELVRQTYVSDLSGRIDMTGEGMNGKNLTLHVAADLEESWFDEYHATRAQGGMTITTTAIDLHDEFLVEYKGNMFFIRGRLEYTGDVDLTGRTRFEDLAAFNRQTFIDSMGGRADLQFHVTGALKNPDIAGNLRSDSLWLYGIYSRQGEIDFELSHFLYDRDGRVDMRLYNGAAYDLSFDSISMQMRVDSQFVRIDDGQMANKFAAAETRGWFDYYAYPQRLYLDSLAVEIMGLQLHNESAVQIAVDSAGYDFRTARLLTSDGSMEFMGRTNYDESMDMTIAVDRINVTPLVRLIADTLDVGGRLSGRIGLQGFFEGPLIDFSGRIDSLAYRQQVLGDLAAEFDYRDRGIKIDSIIIDSHTGKYRAEGYFPIDLSFTEVEKRLPEAAQEIDIFAEDTRLDAVSLLLAEVESLKGRFAAQFKLTGTPLKPQIDGEITLNDGNLKLYDLVLPLEDVGVRMKLSGQTIGVDSLSAICRQGNRPPGKVSGGGTIIINSISQYLYDLKIKAEQFPAVYELGDVSAVANANLTIAGLTPPLVAGDVLLSSATYRENFSKETDGWVILTSLQGDQTWDLNLNVDVASNLWIKNDDIDAEFAGRLNFIRENGVYRYIGSLEILRGKGFLADRTFRIEPGSLISYNDIEYPNPSLDIYATTKIRGATSTQGGTTETPTYELRVHITGTLEEPVISAAEGEGNGPQFTTEEIIPLIFTDYYGDGSSSMSPDAGRLASGLTGYLSSQMGQIGSKSLGVETFEIDPVYGDRFNPLGTKLTVGFYTHPNLYVYGRSAISGVAGQEVGFEYRLKRFLLVEGRRDEGNLYHLLLNFYWEY